jgi:hypothetical protein
MRLYNPQFYSVFNFVAGLCHHEFDTMIRSIISSQYLIVFIWVILEIFEFFGQSALIRCANEKKIAGLFITNNRAGEGYLSPPSTANNSKGSRKL